MNDRWREKYYDKVTELNLVEKERDELKGLFLHALAQGCGVWNREKDRQEYDSMCISAWESGIQFAFDKGWIKKNQVLRW